MKFTWKTCLAISAVCLVVGPAFVGVWTHLTGTLDGQLTFYNGLMAAYGVFFMLVGMVLCIGAIVALIAAGVAWLDERRDYA